MKKHTLLLFSLCIPMIMHALTVTSTAGGLSTAITTAGGTLSTVTNLTVTGNIDARDFRIIRDNMPALTSIDLSSSNIIKYIGDNGTVPSIFGYDTYEANTVPPRAFFVNTGLTSISIPTATTSIEFSAFYACTNLSSINIPSLVTFIGENCFVDCSSLTSVTIPSSVATIDNLAFSGSSAYITVNASNTKYYSADGVLFSDENSLRYCPTTKTGSYTIPSTTTSIYSDAFNGCINLSSISIPASVFHIASNGFSGCSNLSSIYAHATTPIDFMLSFNVFSSVNKTTCVLHVPVGSKAAYQAAEQWKDFTNIVEDLNLATTNPSAKKINASIQNGRVVISQLSENEKISIYNTQGAAVYNQLANSETVIINLPSHGIYIIRIGNESVKVVY